MGEWGERESRREARASARHREPVAKRDRNFLPWLIGLGVAAAIFDIPFFSLLLAAFFLNLALRHDAWWAWIPGGLFAFRVIDDVIGDIGDTVSLPVVVMAAGGLLLLRDKLSEKTLKVGLVACLVLGLIAVADNKRESVVVERDGPDINISAPGVSIQTGGARRIPPLRGRALVVRGDDADIDIRWSPEVREARLVSGRIRVTENEDQVSVAPDDDSIEIELPADAMTLQVRTGGGDVDLEIEGDPTLSLRTSDGEIDLDGFDGADADGGRWEHSGADAGRIEVRTGEGDIDVEREARQLR